MKGITKTAVLIMTAMFALSGCSAESSGGTGASLPEISGAAAEETLEKQVETFETPETSETEALTTAQSEESTQEEETTLDEAEDEPIVLKVWAPKSELYGFQNGWADKVLLDEFNIQINYVECYEADFDRFYREDPDIDIFVWPWLSFYEVFEGQNFSLEWDDALMEYAPYLKTYLGEYIDCVTELSGGKRCGFISDATILEQQEQETVWTIGKGSTHPEAAMRLLNWLVSSEGELTTLYGPRGVCWDIDGDGYYYLTELGVQFQEKAIATFPEEYGGKTTFFGMGLHGLEWMFRPSTVNPDSVHGETYDWTTWHLMQERTTTQ